MKKLIGLTITVVFVAFFSSINAQNSYVVTVYGDTISCDSVVGSTCIISGKENKDFEAREISMSVSNGDKFIFKNGFNKGKIIMASDSVLLTVYRHVTLKHGKETTNTHVFFVNRSNLKILHEYASWYLDGAEMVIKYFPKNKECPKYNTAILEYDAACRKGIRPPTIEARVFVRAWNDCFPLK